MDTEFDELVDLKISESLSGEAMSRPGRSDSQVAGYEYLASEISRVLTEESPRLSPSAQARHLAQLRARAASNRRPMPPGLGWLLHAAPRWAQVAAIALVVVIVANGITVASASSLPGSPLYPVKRLAEQSGVLFAPTAGERARIWMDLAGRRLDEVQRLLLVQPRVDPKALDDIDESILRALTEIAGTRGTERLALLQQIIQLAFREQTVLDQLAVNADSDDRARFQQTSRLMQDVAHIAGSSQTNLGLPESTPTGTSTATVSPTSTLRPTETMTNTPTPTYTPVPASPVPSSPVPPTSSPSVGPNGQPSPDPVSPGLGQTPTPPGGQGEGGHPSETPERERTGTPEGGQGGTPGPSRSETPEAQNTASPGPRTTETPNGQNASRPLGLESATRLGQDGSAPTRERGSTTSSRALELPQASIGGTSSPARRIPKSRR